MHCPKLYEMALSHFNEPMIAFCEVTRCIGYAEDHLDCYIIVLPKNRKPVWNTCVGGYTFLDGLKGQNQVNAHNGEVWDDFTRLDSELSSFGAPRQEAFELVIDHVDHTLEKIIEDILPDNLGEFLQTIDKEKAASGFYVDRVMTEIKGRADPTLVRHLVEKRLGLS